MTSGSTLSAARDHGGALRGTYRKTRHSPVEFAPGVYRLALGGPGMKVNVYLVRSGRSWVLIDTGLRTSGPKIRKAADLVFGDASRPSAILITHTHPDHVGSAAELARTWGCPVYLHPNEMCMVGDDEATVAHFREHSFPIDRRLFLPFFSLAGGRHLRTIVSRRGLKQFARALQVATGDGGATKADGPAEETSEILATPGLPDWEAISTPGHTPGHVAFFRRKDRVLLSGDAVVTKAGPLATLVGIRAEVCRPPGYFTWNRHLARDSIAKLAEREPRVVAGGHGEPRQGDDLPEKLRALAKGD